MSLPLPVCAAEPPVGPGASPARPELVTLCELARNPQSYDHKAVVLLGRISKKGADRFVSLDDCESPADAGPKSLAIHFDSVDGPLPPINFGLNADDVRKRFSELGRRTTIHDFPFGSGSYEHWGIVYGRVELPGHGVDTARLICRGESLIFLWNGR